MNAQSLQKVSQRCVASLLPGEGLVTPSERALAEVYGAPQTEAGSHLLASEFTILHRRGGGCSSWSTEGMSYVGAPCIQIATLDSHSTAECQPAAAILPVQVLLRFLKFQSAAQLLRNVDLKRMATPMLYFFKNSLHISLIHATHHFIVLTLKIPPLRHFFCFALCIHMPRLLLFFVDSQQCENCNAKEDVSSFARYCPSVNFQSNQQPRRK